MLTDRARVATRGLVEPIVAVLGRLGVAPDALTVAGAVLHVGVAALLADGHLVAGAALLAVAAGCDGLDGSLARRTGRASAAGAFLDSCLDRVSEALVFFGLLVYAQRTGSVVNVRLAYVSIVGSLLVSYTRARSEALGAGTRAGLLGRLERTLVVVAGLVFGQVSALLWLLAVGTLLTAGHRVVDGLRLIRRSTA